MQVKGISPKEVAMIIPTGDRFLNRYPTFTWETREWPFWSFDTLLHLSIAPDDIMEHPFKQTKLLEQGYRCRRSKRVHEYVGLLAAM